MTKRSRKPLPINPLTGQVIGTQARQQEVTHILQRKRQIQIQRQRQTDHWHTGQPAGGDTQHFTKTETDTNTNTKTKAGHWHTGGPTRTSRDMGALHFFDNYYINSLREFCELA